MKDRASAAAVWLLGVQEWEESHTRYKQTADLLVEMQSRIEELEKENASLKKDAARCRGMLDQRDAAQAFQREENTMSREIEDRVKRAEREVHACLNYGGVFHDGGPTSKELELTYEQGDLSDELPHMRRFAAALNELADALEAENDRLSGQGR